MTFNATAFLHRERVPHRESRVPHRLAVGR